MALHFACTQCGDCCRGRKLPLTVGESIVWLQDGHPVEILCDAVPWALEPPADDLQAAHRRRRSFAASSGTLPVRVTAILVADLNPACPNLLPDQRCAIHHRRPLVCRIYPAEINPFIELRPETKGCPPEAWSDSQPVFTDEQGRLDAIVVQDIQRSRDTDAGEVHVKARMCAALGITHAALANEGFVHYTPDPGLLLAALTQASTAAPPDPGALPWSLVSNRAATLAALTQVGAQGAYEPAAGTTGFRYLGFHPPSPA